MALLKVTDASGRQTEHQLTSTLPSSIGRAPDNQVVLDDPRASRHHAHVKPVADGSFMIIDGVMVNGQLKRSANKVFVNGEQRFEHPLRDGDRVTIGASTLRFVQPKEERTADLSYDDKPLGHTQLLMSAKDVLTTVLKQSESGAVAGAPRDKVLESLQRKANILSELYEMSKALGSGFDLDKIFKKATDIIFRHAASLSAVYPALIHHAIETFDSQDVLRFLGRRTNRRFGGRCEGRRRRDAARPVGDRGRRGVPGMDRHALRPHRIRGAGRHLGCPRSRARDR